MFVASIAAPPTASNILALGGIGLMLVAAWLASRWWLLPVAFVGAMTAFMFVVLHKRD
jgi:fatty acid desaturase